MFTTACHAFPSYSFNNFNIILPSTPRYSKCYFFRFPYQNFVCISLLYCTFHISSHYIASWCNHLKNTCRRVNVWISSWVSLVRLSFLSLSYAQNLSHPVLEKLQPMFLSYFQRTGFKLLWKSRQNLFSYILSKDKTKTVGRFKQGRQCTYDVTVRRVCETIVAVEKQ